MSDVKQIVMDAVIARIDDPSKQNVTPEMSFIEAGLDSLDTVEYVMELEEKFGIDLPDEDMNNLKNLQDLVDYIEAKKNAKETNPA